MKVRRREAGLASAFSIKRCIATVLRWKRFLCRSLCFGRTQEGNW